jgi:cell shape-determining protein MreD
MNWFESFLLLAVAFALVFLQSTVTVLRDAVGAQIDLLPSLVVYVSLSRGVPTLTLLAVAGGLWFDTLSANPVGVSVLPLFLAGFVIQRSRGMILRDQAYAQFVLGAGATAAVAAGTVLLLVNAGAKPLLSWFSLWQWIVLSVAGGAMTPWWFVVFDRLHHWLTYRAEGGSSFRTDREIKRGR